MTKLTTFKLLKENFMPKDLKGIPRSQMEEFCKELRQELINIVSVTGGHIGPNLGVIELTAALYYVYDFPKDRVIWDIGHQAYVQKMLTGRTALLRTNRQNGKSPGYCNKEESEYDTVTSSHAGASVSLALGIALGNLINSSNNSAIAVVGDGSFVEGSIQEAMNHLAIAKGKTVVIINDNERAIEENYGGFHEYFKGIQVGADFQDTLFSSINVNYIGPIDGHDIEALIENLENIKENYNNPVVLHIKTVKGKGLDDMALQNDMRIHWNPSFNQETFEKTEVSIFPGGKDNSGFAGQAIEDILANDPKSILITPAVRGNVGLSNAFKEFPDQCIDVSLAEQHAVTLAGGFAIEGIKTIVGMESTFMIRSFGQIKHDICINNFPILIVAARSGHGFTDHITHNALEDIAYLRSMPNLRIVYPICAEDIAETIRHEYENLSQPTIVLFPKANTNEDPQIKEPSFFNSNEFEIQCKSANGIILSVGPQNRNAEILQQKLQNLGIDFIQYSVKEIYPLSKHLTDIISNFDYVITLEEGILDGGFGSSILELIDTLDVSSKILRIGFEKQFIEHGTRDYIYKKYKIDSDSVIEKMKNKFPEIF